MKQQGFNPYLPSWEYIPDGEPHVFDGRVYIFGSHDRFNGYEFCPNDYVSYSAPVDDLKQWRYEGVIYSRTADPRNQNGEQCLYAPDVTRGPDGKYYLYYCLNKEPVVSVAVCETPAGQYCFLGTVHYPDGTPLGEKTGDEPQFDPGVLTEGSETYLYTGFASEYMPDRKGAMCTVLAEDMLTIKQAPHMILPSKSRSVGTGFEGHAFFEASSIRKINNTYYFIYSSVQNHELCYATSHSPTEGFEYRGVIVSNIDLGIDTYKDANQPMGYRNNNHGGIEKIGEAYYIFYHRHTNNYSYSRQGCLEPIFIKEDGSIPQVEMSSCGPNGGPLAGEGYYPAYIACNVYRNNGVQATEELLSTLSQDSRNPYITQEGRDGDETPGFIENMLTDAIAGFKYFECKSSVLSCIQVRVAYQYMGKLELALSPYGEAIGSIDLSSVYTFHDSWAYYDVAIPIPDGVNALYFRVKGICRISFGGFALKKHDID